jgi:vacuolar-type H+-ATPase subunit C/Vma6
MTPSWEALVARARGLSAHLLPDERVRALERAADATELALALRETPYQGSLAAAGTTPGALELQVTRSLAERMALLGKWAGPNGGALAPVFLEQDARNVRDILRGLVGALTPEERTASAIPTPSLPWKRLAALARLESPSEVAAKLVAWGHPLGSALAEEAGASRPDLFRLETALARRAAEVSARSARKGGRRMREFVRESIDAANAITALLLVGARAEGAPAEIFVDGGGSLSREELVRAASAVDRAGAMQALAEASRGTPLAEALSEAPAPPAALADRILRARIAAYAKRSRLEPLTAVPVLLFVLRLRREARVVRRALWTTALARGRAT